MCEPQDLDTFAQYFRPVGDELWNDPVLGPVLRQLKETDPDVIEAVADVDRSQIRQALALTPRQRLEQAFAVTMRLGAYRRAAR